MPDEFTLDDFGGGAQTATEEFTTADFTPPAPTAIPMPPSTPMQLAAQTTRERMESGFPSPGQVSVAPPVSQVLGLPFRALGAVGADILNRARMEGAGTPEVLAPRFGETPEERAERLRFRVGKPLYIPRGTTIEQHGSDLERLISQWSTPETLAMFPAGMSRVGGALILASIAPSLPGQLREVVKGEGTDEEKRDRINNLLSQALLMAHGMTRGGEIPSVVPPGEKPTPIVHMQRTVTETTPPVPKSEIPAKPSATGILPAVRKAGGETVVGEAGQTHPQIMAENKIPREQVDQRVFVKQATGEVLDREQAAAATPQLPTETEAGRRHSTDLPEAKATEVPPFAARYDPETLMQRPAWVEPGSKLDQVLGDLREKNDPFAGVDIAPIWKTLDSTQRQDLASRGWIVTDSRDPKAVILKLAQDVPPARKYYGVQAKKALQPPEETAAEKQAMLQAELAKETPKAKEPWEMTHEDYFKQELSTGLRRGDDITASHHKQVKKAVKEGKPVPAEVLADYPDLQKPPPAQAAPPAAPAAVEAKAPTEDIATVKAEELQVGDIFRSAGDKRIAPVSGKVLKVNPKTIRVETEYMGKPMQLTVKKSDLTGEIRSKKSQREPTPAAPGGTGPGMVGMGGAVPSEFGGTQDYVSNMFAAIDRDRVAMGKPPMEPTRPRTWDEDNARALAQMNHDPEWIPNLLNTVEKSPRPFLSWENAGVVWHRAKLKAEYNNALQRIARAFDDNRTEDLNAAKVEAAAFEDQLERLDRIVGRNGTGSEAGRSLQAQKMGAGDDFTLVEMTLQKRAAVGGRRLTPEETSAIEAKVKALQTLNDKLAADVKNADARRLQLESDLKMAQLRAETAPRYDKRILAAAESIVVKMERAAEPHAAKLREMMARMSAGVDPELIYHAAFVGSARIARLGLDAAKFADDMATQFGEKIRPLIPQIWAKANEMLDAAVEKAPEPVKRIIKKTDLQEIKKGVATAIKEKVDKGEMSKVTYEINKLAKVFWQNGVREREAMVNALYDAVGPETGLSRRQVAEAFAGYGDFRQLSKTEMAVSLRGMKGELQQIAKLEAMKRGEPPLKSGLERRTPTEVERKLIKEVNDAKNKFQIPVEDPATQLKSSLDTLKTTLQNRIADYTDRIARKDYAPRPRREVQLDVAALRLKAEAERIKKQWRQELLADRMKNRTLWEKALDWGTKYRRFTALSSPVVLPKLLGAAGWRALSTAAEDIAGGALSIVPGLRQISQRAPIEGAGGQLKATLRGYGAALTRGLEDAAKVARTGQSDIDVLYGKFGESYTGENEMASALLHFPGRMHGVIKAPVKRGGFAKATSRLEQWHADTAQRLAEWYARQGFPVASDMLKHRIALDAYKYGNRQIFLQDNRVVSGFNAALRALEQLGESGHPAPGGKVLATAARFMFPVTKVPVNIAGETLQYATGLETGSVRALKAIRNGLDTLTPDQADLIMRELKKGSVGTAALFLGYMGYRYVGGVYEQGRKKKAGEIKPDAARIFGVDIAGNLLHHPVMNTIQLGATIHRTAEEKRRKGDAEVQGLTPGLIAASWGLADEVPFIQGPHRLFGGLADPRTRERTLGTEVGSVAIPQAVAWVAQVLDQRRETTPANLYQRITGPPAPLKPRNLAESLETRIPGLRQNVPEKKGR